MKIFVSKVEWYDPTDGSQIDTLLIPASTFSEAVECIADCYKELLCCIHYLEPWDPPIFVDDDFYNDLRRIKEGGIK